VSPPNRDKLTMRFKPLKSLGLILSLSKDEAGISVFFSILLVRPVRGGVVDMQAIPAWSGFFPERLHRPQFTEQHRQLPLQGCLIAAELSGQAFCKEGIERASQNELDVFMVSLAGSAGISGKAGSAEAIGDQAYLARVDPSEDRRFEGRNAPQPPENTDNPVSQLTLDRAFWRKFIKDALTHCEELFGAFAGEKATIGRKPVCQGVSAALRFAFPCPGPSAEPGVNTVCRDLSFTSHKTPLA
jgi:hypothetical protein